MSIEPSARFGPYEIQFRLGAGGMGEVYLAHDPRLGRDLAIKILPRDMATDPERLKRFEKEARLASSLNHPNIVTIYDIGSEGTTPYIAMELVDGSTVREILRAGPMPLHQVIDVATQVADGLAKAHEAGVVHRDLKPENVMVTKEGLAKILDFGLGKHRTEFLQAGPESVTAQAMPALTADGRIVGTVDYMSPEQAAGRSVDFRSDQFSFGSLLCEMATGVRPFHRDSVVQTLSAIIEDSATSLVGLKAPAPFHLIVERCLQKDPEHRFSSTRMLVNDLRQLAATLSDDAAITHASRLATWMRRRRARAILAGVSVVALAVVGLWIARPSLRSWLFPPTQPAAGIPERKNLAVLPFRTKGDNVQDGMLAAGLSEALTTKLTQLTLSSSLQVASAAEVRRRRVGDAAQARMLLGANVILDSLLERTDGSLRVTSRLVDPATERELSAKTVTTSAADALALTDGLVEAVVEMLHLNLTAPERQGLGARDTNVAAAKDAYLRARGYFQNLDKSENLDRAISLLQDALQADPRYTLAEAALGEVYSRKYEDTKDGQWMERARQACEQALALDAKLAAPHGCLGTVHIATGRYVEAVPELRQAIALEPTSDEFLRALAFAQEHLGQTAEAEKTYQQAIALRPHYWLNYNRLGVFYHQRGRYQAAVEMFKQVASLAPDSVWGYTNLCADYIMLGTYNDAIPMCDRSATIRPTAGAYSNLATAYFFGGKLLEASQTYEEAAKLNQKDYRVWGNLGDARYWAPGQRPRAAEAYGKAIILGMDQLKVNPRDATVLGYLAGYQAMLGNPVARDLIRRALQIAPNDPEVRFKAALVANQFKDDGATLDWLEKAVASGYSVTTIRDYPNFDHLWSHPRFQQLLRGR